MRPLRVLVADDEPLARDLVRSYVGRDSELEVVGESADGASMLRQIDRLSPDIVLLDIEMPECDGIEAVERADRQALPVFVFVTAYERYARRAFEVEALDYVLKPVEEKRLAQALARAKTRVRERQNVEIALQVARLAGEIAPGDGEGSKEGYLSRLAVRSKGRTLLLRVEEVVWIESQDYYVRVHTPRHRPLLRATLASLEEGLDPERFCRVHRSAIVNLRAVEELVSDSTGRKAVLLSDGSRVRVSRSRLRRVDEALQLRPRGHNT